MKEYRLDSPLTVGFFEYLKYFGRVESLNQLGEGYYNFEKRHFFSIKGFVGDTTVEVRFVREVMDVTTGLLRLLFTSYCPDVEISTIKERESSYEAQVKSLLNLK